MIRKFIYFLGLTLLLPLCLKSKNCHKKRINQLFNKKTISTNACDKAEFEGFVKVDKNLELVPTQSDSTCQTAIGVITVGDSEQRFIHNYGPSGVNDANTFVGIDAGNFTLTGVNNTALGYNALNKNKGGTANTAAGSKALELNPTGSFNTALGYQALQNNFTTSSPTGTGSNNIGIGYQAGVSLTNGSNNIYMGSTGVASESNAIRIGNVSQQTCFIGGIRTNGIVSGAGYTTVFVNAAGQLGTSLSSIRYKKDVESLQNISEKMQHLRAVTFHYNQQPANDPLEYGLIAEEVLEAFPELVIFDKDNTPETVRYDALPILLLQSYQQQQQELKDNKKELLNITDQYEKQEKKLDELLERLIALESQLSSD